MYGLAAFTAPIAAVVTALILGKSKRPLPSAWTLVAGAAFLDTREGRRAAAGSVRRYP